MHGQVNVSAYKNEYFIVSRKWVYLKRNHGLARFASDAAYDQRTRYIFPVFQIGLLS